MPRRKPKEVNVTSASDDWRGAILSNFPLAIYSVDGERVFSAEGFIQGIKFRESYPRRAAAFRAHGFPAKNFGRLAKKKWVWWKGRRYAYASLAHSALVERGIRARFIADSRAREALLATLGETITHNVGDAPRKTSLRKRAFCRLLTRMRAELKKTGAINPR